jgi:hypothetical protein
MKCQNCGNEFEGKFCPDCGTPAPTNMKKFCSNCGAEMNGNFCSNCGASSNNSNPRNSGNSGIDNNTTVQKEEKVLWEGKPSGIMDKAKTAMNVNSVTYTITNQRITVIKGLLSTQVEEIELYKVKDQKIEQSLIEKATNVGNVIIYSIDPSTPVIKIEHVENPMQVKDIIRNAVLDCKNAKNIVYKEHL